MKKDNEVSEVENEELDEMSAAEDTLKPKSKSAGSDPKSRVEYMKHIVNQMAGMEDHHLEKWWKEAVALVGKEARKVKDVAGSNKSSIAAKPSDAVGHGDWGVKMPMPKISVKEDLDKLFEADDTLTEETKEKMSVIFESAVTARVMMETERLQEEYTTLAEEAATEVRDELEAQLSDYLDYCASEFLAENEVAIVSTLRAQLVDEFMNDLHGLLESHWVNVPESKVDLIEELSIKIEDLEGELHNAIEENSELKGLEAELVKLETFDDIAEGLTISQKEKFETLAESVDFEGNVEEYSSKLAIIKEHNFPKTTSSEDNLDEINEDNNFGTETKYVDPEVNAYIKAMDRISKR